MSENHCKTCSRPLEEDGEAHSCVEFLAYLLGESRKSEARLYERLAVRAPESLLDFFAGMALAAWLPIASKNSETGEVEPEELMRLCYDTADAMMRERSSRRNATIGLKEGDDEN